MARHKGLANIGRNITNVYIPKVTRQRDQVMKSSVTTTPNNGYEMGATTETWSDQPRKSGTSTKVSGY